MEQNVAAFMEKLSETWETLPTYFITSSERRTGREEILEFIEKTVRSIKTSTSEAKKI
jgi:GTP-binding protein